MNKTNKITIDKKITVKADDSIGNYSLVSSSEREKIILFYKKRDIKELENYIFTKYREYYAKDMFDYLNHGYHFILKIEDKTVLNIGVGEGTESIFFSLFGAKHIYSMDLNPERLEMLKMQAKFHSVESKITTICADFTQCIIEPNSFDIITMIGVLEWLPKSINPYAEQLTNVKKVYSSLKPDGTFLLGIENRFCPIYFLGKTNHNDLPFTPIMPRFMAHALTYLFRRKPYTTYTYTNNGYKKLFREAGFEKISVYPVLFSYQEPKFIFNSMDGLKEVLRKFGVHPIFDLGARALSYFPKTILIKLVPSYIIIGKK